MLAQLPHVGGEASPQLAAPTAAPDDHSAETGYYDYREQRRSRDAGRQTRYIDQAHIDHEWEREDEYHEPNEISSRPSNRASHLVHRRRAPSDNRRSPVSALLSAAHEQVAPFAGLIVTAALIAAACLLFHIMSSDSQMAGDYDKLALPDFRVEISTDNSAEEQTTPLADARESSESAAAPNGEQPDEPLPTADEIAPTPETSAATEPITLPLADTTAALGQLMYPATGSPLALDYSKVADPELLQLPEVAERPRSPDNVGINR